MPHPVRTAQIARGQRSLSKLVWTVSTHTPERTFGFDEAMLRRMIAQHITITRLFSRDDNIAKFAGLTRFRQLGGRHFRIAGDAPEPHRDREKVPRADLQRSKVDGAQSELDGLNAIRSHCPTT